MGNSKLRKRTLAIILSVVTAVTFAVPVTAAPAGGVQDVQADQIQLAEDESGAITEVLDADTYLNVANGIEAGVYGWVKSENGTYYTLGSINEDGTLLTKQVPGPRNTTKDVYIGIFNETQITNPEYQTMVVHVPAAYLNEDGSINYDANINGYTAATAPIIFENNNSGWNSGSTKMAEQNYIDQGFIHVFCGSRSRDAVDANGYRTGKAPKMVVDLKAGVIQLRANADVIPGDKEAIISVGASGAGQMSSILGASGDMPEYYPYLAEYGANGVTANGDGTYTSLYEDCVYAAQCFCPIADLENADLAYAWMHFDTGATGMTAMNGTVTEFTEFDLALQNLEAKAFVEYINGLNLKDENGNSLTLESERSGSYYDAVLQNISDSLNAYAAGTEFPLELKDRSGNVTATYASMDEMIAGRYTDTDKWLVKNEDGTYSVTDMAGFINGTSLIRNKAIPGFDTMSGDAENNAFGRDTEYSVHYSAAVGKILQDNYDTLKELDGFNQEYVDAYINDTITDTEKAAYIDYQTNLMNATEILLGSDGINAVHPAQYFRTRNGTADQHTSFTIAYNLCLAANDFGTEIDYSLVWDMGHGSEEGTTTGTFIEWVEDIVPIILPPETSEDLTIETTFSDNELNVKVDNKALVVRELIDNYVANPTHVGNNDAYDDIDQLLSIYVPENATANSPIMLYVNNSGWQANSFSGRTKIAEGNKYFSNKDSDKVGRALANGYVIVSYGCRSRNDAADEDGKYVGHSPATMTDTKAVIRYLRANASLLPAGNPERIVVTGTSGGGALSTIIAASGNSSEYFESLFDIGAAGMIQYADGTYASEIGDDVFATIAYCPINDLREADAAYEFTYNNTREELLADIAAGKVEGLTASNVFNQPLGMKDPDESKNFVGYNFDETEALNISKQLADQYGEYVDSLGLKLDDGTALTKDNLMEATEGLLKAEIAESVDELGADQIKADLEAAMPAADGAVQMNATSSDWNNWLTTSQEEQTIIRFGREQKQIVTTVDVDSFDLDAYLYYVARNKKLKVPYAFSNAGLGIASQNEDSLYGTEDYQYSPYEFLSWNNDKTLYNGAGLDDTGMDWDQYMATEEGKELALQLDMSSPIPYLTNMTVAGTEDSFGDSAPYWYVRHGMADRDTSFALQTVLRYALTNDDTIEDVNFEFAWLKSHSGDYDVNEAYSWLERILKEDTETELDIAKALLDAAEEALEDAQKAVDDAETAKEEAVQKAEEAEQKAEAAYEAANHAITQAEQLGQDLEAANKLLEETKAAKEKAEAALEAAEKKAATAKAVNPITVKKTRTITVAAAKKTKKVAAKKAFGVTKAQGKVTYAKFKGNAKITVNAKGKVTVKKGLKKGKTYKVKVQITAAGNKSYEAAIKTVTLKVKIK